MTHPAHDHLLRIACLVILCGALAAPAGAEIFYVSHPDSLQDQIMACTPGDTVLVAPGTYGLCVLQSGVNLIAEKGPSETILRNNMFWVVKADSVDNTASIEGFFIDGGRGAEGVILAEESSFTIRDCEIHGGWSGIRALYSQLTIENCTIRECQNGIYMFESEGLVANNDIQLCINAITLVSAAPRVIRNSISRNTVAFRIADHSEPVIGGSLASANRIFNNQSAAIKNEAYLKRASIRTMKPATLKVPYNYWGSDCPSSGLFANSFGGSVEFSPWVDETGTRSLEECDPE